MKNLSVNQRALLELALEEIHSFIKDNVGVDIKDDMFCFMYGQKGRFIQCSEKEKIAWEVYINLRKRCINIYLRKMEFESICSKFNYDIYYMSNTPTYHTIYF